MKKQNIFKKIPATLPAELFEPILDNGSIRLERIISKAHATPQGQWYDQEKDEWVLLLSGSAGIRLEGGDQVTVLEAGDYLLLPAHIKHRVEWTQKDAETIWLALHY